MSSPFREGWRPQRRRALQDGFEPPIASLFEGIRPEGLQELALDEVALSDTLLQHLELIGIFTVKHAHRVASAYESEVLEPGQPAHSVSSSPMPVSTSAEHIGHVTLGTRPTMKLNPHSGHSIFGIGCSGGGGGGGAGGCGDWPPTPGAV